MFTKKPLTEKSELDTAITDLFVEMAEVQKDSPEYATMVDQVVKLHALTAEDRKIAVSSHVSKDTWAIIAANLAGILMIVGYERANVVASKALSLLMKLK